MERTILHSDINACYASIEELYHPQLRGYPLAVAGDPEARCGIILAKNQLAKQAGVKTGMTIGEARALCPDLYVLPARMELYLYVSSCANEIYARYTDRHESFGLDEQWLDVTDCLGRFGHYTAGAEIADEIRRTFVRELGITVSVGVSWNKIFSKLGSDYKKPDAVTVITPENYREIVYPLPADQLLMVGGRTKKKLDLFGIHTIGQLAEADDRLMELQFGKVGGMLKAYARGEDDSPVIPSEAADPIKSIGNSCTTVRDMTTDEEVRRMIYAVAETVAARLREGGFRCQLVELWLRDRDLMCFTRQWTLGARRPASGGKAGRAADGQPVDHAAVERRQQTGTKSRMAEWHLESITSTNSTAEIAEIAYQLYLDQYVLDGSAYSRKPLRGIGIRTARLVEERTAEQMTFFSDPAEREKREKIDDCVDTLRRRFGCGSVQRGCLHRFELAEAIERRRT